MEKVVNFDKQGRIYIPEEMRKYLQFKTMIAKVVNDAIILEPVEDNPIKALSHLGKGKLKNKSVKQLKKQAREDLKSETFKKIRR